MLKLLNEANWKPAGSRNSIMGKIGIPYKDKEGENEIKKREKRVEISRII